MSPGSRCPRCGHPLAWREKIPLLSYLMLRGACQSCRGRISLRYPLVEGATGLLFAILGILASPPGKRLPWAFSWGGQGGLLPWFLGLLAYMAFLWGLVVLAAIDLEHRRLPDALTLPLALIGFLLLGGAGLVAGEEGRILSSLVSGLGLAGLLLLVALVYPGGMGLGDVKLAGVIGIYLGWSSPVLALEGLFLAVLAGGVVAVALLAAGRSRKETIPFGPFLSLGAAAALFLADLPVQWWLKLLSR